MEKHFATAFTIITLTVIMAAGMLTLPGCNIQSTDTKGNQEENATVMKPMSQRLAEVPEEKDFVYDIDTHIVYYMLDYHAGYMGYGWMSPYYGEHGRPCQYTNGKIVELSE